LLRTGRHALDGILASLAQSLARVAAVAILQQRQLRRSAQAAEQFRHALDSRVLIEQAKGAVAARLGITPEAAFELLRAFARRHNHLLTEVAAGTIGGELTIAELMTVPRADHAERGGSPAQNGQVRSEAGGQNLGDQVRVTLDDPHVPQIRDVRTRVVSGNHADQATRGVDQRRRLHRAET